jgi:class 3 adenylate cyclase
MVAADGAASETLEGERKTVTALFADVKGSTELMRDLDPEVARAIIDPAIRIMVDAVRRYEGYVVQSTGDGILALFDAPAGLQRISEAHLWTIVHPARQELRKLGPAPSEIRLTKSVLYLRFDICALTPVLGGRFSR